MRIYIIGNDGIALCRKAPATLNDGEIAVASNAELHAAPLSAKRLLALWNALPGVEKRKKVLSEPRAVGRLSQICERCPSRPGAPGLAPSGRSIGVGKTVENVRTPAHHWASARGVWRGSIGEAALRARNKGRAKSWAFRSVADAKGSEA